MDDYLIDRIQVLVDWLNKRVPVTQWSEEEFKDKFAQRNLIEIVDDGATGFIGSCFDYTRLASHYISTYIDNNHDFGVELLKNGNKHNADIGLHTFLSFNYKGQNHTLDFSDRTNIYLYEGEYENAQPLTQRLDSLFLLPQPTDPNSNLLDTYKELFNKLPFSFTSYLEHVNTDNNNPETYPRYLNEIKDQPEFTLKPFHPSKSPKSIYTSLSSS